MKPTTKPGWIARILCIAAILFVSLFALDAFDGSGSLLEKLGAFGKHMIPSIVLALALLLAWYNERAGGFLFLFIALATAPFIYQMNFARTGSALVAFQVIAMINLPFVIVGVLFLVSYFKVNSK
ncbi:MAG: hypothetical protein JNK77_03185 [Saprospiraceae bacterium]|nr:hypothetical protein [Saprospiraceae bacterium]